METGRRSAMGAVSGAPLTVSTNTVNKDDTVNGRPETKAFDTILSRSLTVSLGVTYAEAHGDPVYNHPYFGLAVPSA